MAEVLDSTYQRGLTAARSQTAPSNPAVENEEDPLTEQEEQSQNFLRRRLQALRNIAKSKVEGQGGSTLQQEAEAKAKKEIAKRMSWRMVNVTMGSTVILVFLTVIVWTVQFIGGNMMGSKLIPKLGLGETILWIIGLVVVVTIFNLILLGLTLIAEVFENPGKLVETLINIFWKNFWSGLTGN